MVIHVQPETEAVIREKVERGEYEDADAVIRAALKQLAVQEIRVLIAESQAQYERGEYVELTSEVWAEIEREADEMVRTGASVQPHVLP